MTVIPASRGNGLVCRVSARRALFGALLAIGFLVLAAPQANAQTPFYFGAHLLGHRISELDQNRLGYGFRGGYEAYLPFISLEGEVNVLPSGDTAALGETQGLFGLKFGKKVGRWGAFLKARPGFTHFAGGAFPARLTERTKFALDLGGGLEYAVVPKVDVRFDIGDTRIYFGDAVLISAPGATPGPRLGTQGNLQTSFGLVVHF